MEYPRRGKSEYRALNTVGIVPQQGCTIYCAGTCPTQSQSRALNLKVISLAFNPSGIRIHLYIKPQHTSVLGSG